MIASNIRRQTSAIAVRAQGAMAFHPPMGQYFGQGIGNQPSAQTLLRESLGVFDAGTRAIANRIASLNPLVKVSRRAMDGTTEDEILDDHVLKIMLDNPHPDYSRSQMLRLVGQYMVEVGEAYFLKVSNGLGVPTELHPIPPWLISPKWERGVIAHYFAQDGNGKQFPIRKQAVLHPFFPDPESPWMCEGYLGPSGITVDSAKFAGQHLRAHYQHDATPKTALLAGETASAFSDDQETVFFEKWRAKYNSRRGSQRGTPAIIPTGYTLKELAMQTGVEIVPLLDFWQREQLIALGVPKSVLGEVVSGDRSSAETNQYVFDLHTVKPIVTVIQDALTNQLAKDFDPSLFVEFEEFVSEDKAFRLEKQTADLRDKVRSINLVREDDGLDPVPWGDEPVGKIGEMPYTAESYEVDDDEPGAIEDEEPEPPENEDDEDERSRRLKPRVPSAEQSGTSRAAQFFTPDAEWERQLAREKAYTPSFEKGMLSILTEQKRDVLKKLKAAMPRARVSSDDIFDPKDKKWAKLYGIRVEPIREKAFLAILAEALEGFGIDEFIFTDAMKATLKKQGARLITNTGRTTQKHIAKQLQLGTAEGEGIDQIAKRIRSVFQVRRSHARTIARTEVLKASQTAQLESMEITGTERKRWYTSRDAAVRDSHAYADGQERAKGEAFDLAGEAADAPGIGEGGKDLSAANSINCRCFCLPVVEV